MDEAPATPPPQDAPERLLERYAAGDDAAFGELVARYEARLYAFIHRMVGDSHLAEDVFQQTCIKMARGASSFDGRATLSTWLFRIARNAAVDELRRRAARPDGAAGPMAETADPAADAAAPLDRLEREELGDRIRAALMRIPEDQREVFLLKEEGELDFAAIGAVLGCGRETAKSRFRLAVAKLRSLLASDGPGGKVERP